MSPGSIWPVVLVLLQPLQAGAGPLTDERASDFVRALIDERDRLESFAHPDELAMSGRLGIRYLGVDHKFLISYDLDSTIRARVDPGRAKQAIQPVDPEHNVARLVLTFPGTPDSLSFLFEDSLLISPLRYQTRGWKVIESEHFRFIVSDSASLRDYHVTNLERFFEATATRLGLSEDDRSLLARGKLNYYLCANGAEVQRLTGYSTLGMYNLAYDAIITSYHAHYHELVHLLVNFKLRALPLYTHSLLQEGLAVALGGRGGKEPGPILELGQYLFASGMLDYRELCSDSAYDALDPSMSYPAGGLYSGFLLEFMGLEGYLELYLRHSGGAETVRATPISDSELPPDRAWQEYLRTAASRTALRAGCSVDSGARVLERPHATILANRDRYCFSIRDTLLLLPDDAWRDFRSEQFVLMFGDRPYGGEKYAVVADPQEISVYNLYTGNLIAKCVAGFLIPPTPFESVDEWYLFSIPKPVFEEEL